MVIENIERHIQEYGKPAAQAASDAMGEVIGAVIATALVLVAVFVPVAFFPGTTGRLYQQFALTIAFSVAISAFNALTLTPALSALLLGHGDHGKGVFFRGVERVHHGGTNVLRADAARADARAVGWSCSCSSGCLGADLLGLHAACRRRSCPTRIQGYFITHRAGAAGRVARVHDERRAAGRADPDEGRRRSRRCSRSWASASAAPRRTRG